MTIEGRTPDELWETIMFNLRYAEAYAEAARLVPAAARGLARLERKHMALAAALLLEWVQAAGPIEARCLPMPLRRGNDAQVGMTG